MDLQQVNARGFSLVPLRKRTDLGYRYVGGPFGARLWHNRLGALLLRRYSGKADPRPFRPSLVGCTLRPATAVSAMTGATYSNNTIYWHFVEKVSGGGWSTEAPHEQSRCAVWGASGYVGQVPNEPADVRVCQFGSAKVLVQWVYNPLWQQVAPERFDIFSDGGTGTMDWTTPVANVSFVDGQMDYAWVSGTLSAGAHRYNVRSRSAAGVYSLVPELRDRHVGSLGDYSPVGGINGGMVQLVTASPPTPAAPEFA